MTKENRNKVYIGIVVVFIAGCALINSVSKKRHRERFNEKVEATIGALQQQNVKMVIQIENLEQPNKEVQNKKAVVESLNKKISVNNARINSLKQKLH